MNKEMRVVLVSLFFIGVLGLFIFSNFVMTGDVVKADGDTLWIKVNESKVVTFNGVDYKVSVSEFDFENLKNWSVNSFLLNVNGEKIRLKEGEIFSKNNFGLEVVAIRPETLWWTDKNIVKFKVFKKLDCSDSDGGKNYFERGTAVGSRALDTISPLEIFKGSDVCYSRDANYLYEHYCDEKGYHKVEKVKCDGGCVDGGCVGNIPTWCEGGCPVVVFVDSNTYSLLKYKIDRFVEDIKRDVKAEVFLEKVNIDENPVNIRNKVQNYYDTNRIQGVIFVGDIPYVQVQFTEGLGAYDWCYADTVRDYIFTETSEGWICALEGMSGSYTSRKMWYGRILPPEENKINLFSNYFDRNHAYRTGSLNYDEGSLFYYDNNIDFNNVEETDKPELLAQYIGGYKSLYDLSNIEIISTNGLEEYNQIVGGGLPITQGEYLEKLKESREIVIINQHGLTNHHFPDISSEDIKIVKPQSLAYLFYSCSTGGFQDENYIAGNYLFSGKGLIAIAHSTPIMVGKPSEVRWPSDAMTYNFFNLLDKGVSFGESWITLSNGGGVVGSILGDPTLRLRPQKIAPVKITPDKIEMDKELTLYESTIFNLGNNDLELLYREFRFNHVYDADEIEVGAKTTSLIPAMESKQNEFYFEGDENFDGEQLLVYSGEDGYLINFYSVGGTGI